MKIAIVGNGYILAQSMAGNEIDKANLVVRVHPGTIKKEITGEKTDIIVYQDQNSEKYKDYKASHVVLIGEPQDLVNKNDCIERYGYDKEYVGINDYVERAIRVLANSKPNKACAPTAGWRALHYFSDKFPNAEITLYGFDFFKGKRAHWDELGAKVTKDHNMEAEERVVRGFCNSRNIKIEESIKVDDPDEIIFGKIEAPKKLEEKIEVKIEEKVDEKAKVAVSVDSLRVDNKKVVVNEKNVRNNKK